MPVSYQKERDGDIKYSLSDSSALKGLGFSPVYSIQEGLQKYLKFTHNTKIDKRRDLFVKSRLFVQMFRPNGKVKRGHRKEHILPE